ncbi:hypothetical protein PFNF54_01748 [Plasmodium falciparum NF54]|uniref:Uncharacterized protein n=1 Tax=Plasmodium falciparum (isolate NF54) TaxID=5843 RepID=W7JWY7_PLAFO|nr:hypothetical protein PFNF54_01748 [Plasmodium falciparum NF54]
MHFPYLVTYK